MGYQFGQYRGADYNVQSHKTSYFNKKGTQCYGIKRFPLYLTHVHVSSKISTLTTPQKSRSASSVNPEQEGDDKPVVRELLHAGVVTLVSITYYLPAVCYKH